MSGHEPALPQELVDRLTRLERHVRALRGVRAAAITFVVLAGGIAVCLLLDWMWALSSGVRASLLGGVLVAGVAVGVVMLVRWFLARPTWAELAAIVDRDHPRWRGRLTSTIELADPNVPTPFKGSALMRESLVRETLAEIGEVDFTDSVSSVRAFRWSLIAAAAVLLFLVPPFLNPSGYRLLFARLFAPWGNYESASNLYFEVEDGDRVVARGTDLRLVALPRWRGQQGQLPTDVWLTTGGVEGDRKSRRMEFDGAASAFTATIPQVATGFEYEVLAGRAHSRRYQVTVVDRATVVGMWADIEPPSYTGLPQQAKVAVVNQVPVFEGSRVLLEMQFAKPISSASLEWIEAITEPTAEDAASERSLAESVPFPRVNIADDGLSATVGMTLTRGGSFEVRMKDVDGLEAADATPRRLVVVRDQPPQLALAGDDQPRTIHPDETYPIHVTATDDLGLAALELQYEVFGGDEQGDHGSVELGSAQLGGKSIIHQFPFSPKSWELKDGALISYRVRAADNRPVPGPNETWSKARVLTVDTNARPPQALRAEENQRALRDLLDKVRADLERNREGVEGLAQQADKSEPPAAANDEERARLRDEEVDIARRLESLAGDFLKQPIFSGLAPRVQDAAREDISASHGLLEQFTDASPEDRSKVVDQAMERLAHAGKQLEQVSNEFEQLATLENDLLDLAKLARSSKDVSDDAIELQRRMAELRAQSAENREAEMQEIAAQRESLANRQQELGSDLDDLLDRRPELLEAARNNQLKRLAELARQALELAVPQEQLADSLVSEATDEQPDAAQADATAQELVDAQKRQEQLAREALALAVDTATSLGPETEASRQATELARSVAQTKKDASTGRLNEASQSARQAVERAEQAAKALDANAGGTSTLSSESLGRQAAALGERQQQLAEMFERLGQSTAGRQQARTFAQRKLADDTNRLAKQFSEAAQKMSQEPLNMSEPGEQAQASQQLTTGAESDMRKALDQMAQNEATDAAELGRQAATSLREAAQQASDAAGDVGPDEGPFPGDSASQIADAARHLRSAQARLEQAAKQAAANQSSEEGKGDSEQASDGDGTNQQNANNQSGQPTDSQSQSSGQSQMDSGSDSADALQQASAALNQAVNKLWPEQQSSGGEEADSSGNQEPSAGSPSSESEGDGGGSPGEQELADLEDLEARLDKLSKRNWGQLPGTLRTEILQSSGQDPNGMYARLIQLYFEEIAKTQEAAP